MVSKVYSAVLEDVEKVSIQEFDLPHIGPADALLRIEMAGVCNTDVQIYHGKRGRESFPLIMGHEILGHIAQIGAEAAKQYGVKEGDRVVVESPVRCGTCYYCIKGDYKWCEGRLGYGIRTSTKVPPHLWGAYGQYMYLAPGSILHKISEDVPAEAAVLANAVIGNGLQWVRILGEASVGNAIVIQGMGGQGLSATVAAKESGASPIVVTGLTNDIPRWQLAREFGADYCIDVQREDVIQRVAELTKGRMADLVVDVTGSPEAIIKAIELVKKKGTVVCASTIGTTKVVPLATDKIALNQIRFQGAFTTSFEAVNAAVKLIESKKYPLERIVTHKFPLAEAERALKTVGREVPGEYPIKAVIVP